QKDRGRRHGAAGKQEAGDHAAASCHSRNLHFLTNRRRSPNTKQREVPAHPANAAILRVLLAKMKLARARAISISAHRFSSPSCSKNPDLVITSSGCASTPASTSHLRCFLRC